jgi:hypothetical protein
MTIDANLHRDTIKGAVFFWKTAKNTLQKPKHLCIEEAAKNGCELVCEQEYNDPGNPTRYRRFGYYRDVTAYLADNKYRNDHFYEVATGDCKLYLDLEWIQPDDVECIDVSEYIKTKLIPYSRSVYPGIPIDETDVFVCCASGMGDDNSPYAEQYKQSYHLVVNNGYYYKSTREAKQFVAGLKENEMHDIFRDGLDLAPYMMNQSFKMPYQSKHDSKRVQRPHNGTFRDHLIGRYSWETFKGYYDTNDTTTIITTKNTRTKQATGVAGTTSTNKLDVGRVDTDKCLTETDLKDVPSMLAAFGNDDVPWETYFAITCVLKNEGYEFDDFIQWSRLSTKHDEYTARSAWGDIEKRSEQCYNQNTLRTLLKRKFPSEQNERVFASWRNKIVDQVSKPTISFEEYGYDTASYNERYCQPLAQQFRKYDDIQLHSHLGTGKTTVICDLIREGNYTSIVCITPRVAFAHSIHASLKKVEDRFVLYKDIPKAERYKERFVVCQMESIHTLGDSFDLVIFDESESNLAQLDSYTIVDFGLTTGKLEKLMRNAKKTIWSDAFILDRSLVVCARLRPRTKKVYIQNTHQPYDRKAWKVGASAGEFLKFIKVFQSDNPGKRLVIATGSRQNSDDIYNELKGECKVLKINSYTSDALTRSLEDVNSVWGGYDVIVYTTSVTVGISYDDPDKPFDFLFLHFSCCSSTVRDLFQSSLRARQITTNTLYYSNYSHYKDGDCFGEFDRDRLRTIVEARQGVKLAPWLVDLWVFTHQEKNCSALLHEDVINEYLRICGYKSEDLVPTRKQQRALRKCEIDEDFDDNDYMEIEELTHDEFDAVDLLIKKGEADKCHKQQRKKYEFDNYILIDKSLVDVKVRASMFKDYVRDSSKIQSTKNNVFIERSFSVNGELDKYDTPSIYVNNLKEKVERITTLTRLLGVGHSYDTATITRENLDSTGEYIQANLAALGSEWGLDLRYHVTNDKDTNKKTLGILNQILGKWGFQKITQGKRQRKTCKATKQVVDVSKFELQTDSKYTLFNEYCLHKNWELHVDLFVVDDDL